MKEFDLEKALAGEPVKVRSGRKAFVKYVLPSEYYNGDYPLRGFIVNEKTETGISSVFLDKFWKMVT